MLLSVLLAFTAALTTSSSPEHCDKPSSVNRSSLLNGTYTFHAMPAPLLVPYPSQLAASPAYLSLSATPSIVLMGTPAEQAIMRPAGLLIVSEIRDATAWAIKPVLSSSGGNSPITLALGGGSALVGEAYTLDIASDGVKLTAGTYAGMVAATATLVQAVEMAGDYDAVPTTPQNCTTAPVWRLPVMEVSDSPALPYRGLMRP